MNKVIFISFNEETLYLFKVIANKLNIESLIINLQPNTDNMSVIEKIKKFDGKIILFDYETYIRKNDFIDKLNFTKVLLLSNLQETNNPLIKKANYIIYGQDKIEQELKKIINLSSDEDAMISAEIRKKNFKGFVFHIAKKYKIELNSLNNLNFEKFREIFSSNGFDENKYYEEAADYLGYKYIDSVSIDEVDNNILSFKFIENYKVLFVIRDGIKYLLISNPFDIDSLNILNILGIDGVKIGISNIDNITKAIHLLKNPEKNEVKTIREDNSINIEKDLKSQIDTSPVIYIANKVIENAIKLRASDIHIEPKDKYYSVRYRIDGDLIENSKLRPESGVMVITRLKALSKMDIADRRKPQDGSVSIKIGDKKYILRISTTITNYGEELVARIIDMNSGIKALEELGMYKEQSEILKNLSNSTQGIIVIAAPTGSGKTTTVYSFISMLNLDKKKLMSVEDPVELRIPKAVQQEVNEKSGATFSNLLKASVRQDPDILFIGEIRDIESAKIAFDFAATGHLTITTIHTANATAALNRLERLGISRSQICETVLAIISQRLVKKLCPYCKTSEKITSEQIEVFKRFNLNPPEFIYKAKGCPRCLNTGYYSRIAIYEILKFDGNISKMIISGSSTKEIRKYIYNLGYLLMPQVALKRISEGVIDFEMAFEKILKEEMAEIEENQDFSDTSKSDKNLNSNTKTLIKAESETKTQNKILVVDDDPDLRDLITKILISSNYNVEVSEDGLDALIKIAKNNYDLVISDYDMPNLDGLKLIETINKKNLKTKVIMLTASTKEDAEEKALLYGAIDFIKKPFKKDILLLRIRKAMGDK